MTVRVLVTGATGSVGSHVVSELVALGHDVATLIRPGEQILHGSVLHAFSGQFEIFRGDVRDRVAIDKAVRTRDAVIHLAGIAGISPHRSDEMTSVNVVGAAVVAESALAADVRLVHTSSASAVGFPADGVVASEDFVWDVDSGGRRRHHPYALTKRLGENEVIRRVRDGLNAVVLSPGAVLASGGDLATTWGGLPKRVLRHRVLAVPPGGFAFVGIDQVVAAHVAALEYGRVGQRYLVVGENVTLEHLYRAMAAALDVRRTVIRIPASIVRVAAWTAWAFGAVSGLERLSENLHPRNLPLLTRRMAFDQAKCTAELRVGPEPIQNSISKLARTYLETTAVMNEPGGAES